MTQAGAFGQRHGQFLHQKNAPPSLITRSLRGIELAATETRHDDPVPGLSGQFTLEDAYLVSLKFRDYRDCECWERGRCVIKTDVRAGATYLYDLKRDPRFVIDKPYHSLLSIFRARRSTTSPNRPARRALANSPVSPASAMTTRWSVISVRRCWKHCIGRTKPISFSSITRCSRSPRTSRRPMADCGAAAELARGGLAPWQVKRACERLESDLGGTLSLQQIAAEFDLSVSHFSRAFRRSTGLPPHQWLLRQRVKAAKQLMAVRDLPLSEIAISAGFANQSHFTRVFSSLVGASPGAWRRETHGVPEGEA